MEVLFYIKKTKLNKEGLAPIYCRVTVSGQRSEFSKKLSVDKNTWDAKSNKCKGRNVKSRVINDTLMSMQSSLYRAHLSLKDDEEYIDAKEVVAVYQGKNKKDLTLIGAVSNEIQETKSKKDHKTMKILASQGFSVFINFGRFLKLLIINVNWFGPRRYDEQVRKYAHV